MNSQLSTQVDHHSESTHSYAKHTEENLASYLELISHQRWLIICVALLVSLCGVLYAYLAMPQYESNLLVHVEEKGQREPKNILGEAGSMIDYKTPSAAEIELLRSRQVIARAVDRLKLYIEVKPKRLPVVGKVFSTLGAVNYFPALQSVGGYAWGKEAISVKEFSVPTSFENRLFKIRALEQGSFQLMEPQSGLKKQGQVGQSLSISSPDGEISLMVEDIYAAPGVEFDLARSSRLAIIESVQTSLTVNELGKSSGMISATLKGTKADQVYRLLTEIGHEYMTQNSSRRTEEADKSLAYLNRRLPELRQQLEQAETRYNQFRNANGTVDIGEEGRLSLQRSAAARTRRIELEQKRSELLTRFTTHHPSIIAVDEQLSEVNRELREAGTHLKSLPLLEQEMVRLARDVKVNNELYSALLTLATYWLLKSCSTDGGRSVTISFHRDLIKFIAPVLVEFSEFRYLKKIEFQRLGLSGEGMPAIANLIQANPRIETLDLSGNDIDDDDALLLLSSLQDNTNLRWLIFNTEGVNPATIAKIDELLSQC